MKLPSFLCLIIAALSLVCCRQSNNDRINMDQADSLMDILPDSALRILEGINPEHLRRDEDKALFALLMTRAQDKNGVAVTSDSLISVAVKYYDDNDDIYHKTMSHFYLGKVQLDAGQLLKGMFTMCRVMEYASVMNDRYWSVMARQSLSDAYHEAYNNLNKDHQDTFISRMWDENIPDSLHTAFAELGDIAGAAIMFEAIEQDSTFNGSLLDYFSQYVMLRPPLSEALLPELERSDSLAVLEMQPAISRNITHSVVSHLDSTKQQAQAERNKSRMITWFVVIVSVLVIAILVILGLQFHRRQQEKISKNVETARQLQKLLANANDDYSKAQSSVRALLSERYQTLDELCKLVYENSNTSMARKRISESVVSLIEQLQNDPSLISELESMVNAHDTNLMENFRSDLPGLKDTYYRLFLFSVLGFSDSSISVLLNKQKTSMIWNSRRHLKDKIKQLDTDRKDIYLAYLS